jgi:hypothetical protein
MEMAFETLTITEAAFVAGVSVAELMSSPSVIASIERSASLLDWSTVLERPRSKRRRLWTSHEQPEFIQRKLPEIAPGSHRRRRQLLLSHPKYGGSSSGRTSPLSIRQPINQKRRFVSDESKGIE